MIACSLQDPYGDYADIVVMNADGSGRTRIKTARDEVHVAWGA